MGALTIRNIDEDLKHRLRQQAAANKRSMEEEARVILRKGVRGPAATPRTGLGSTIRRIVETHGGGYDLEAPPRGPARPLPPLFDE